MSDTPNKVPARVVFYARTLGQWTSANPIIPQGELVLEIGAGGTPTIKGKFGNGVSNYLALPYIFGGGSGGTGDLQNVLGVGNQAINDSGSGLIGNFQLKDPTGAFGLSADETQILILDEDGNTSNLTVNGVEFADIVAGYTSSLTTDKLQFDHTTNTSVTDAVGSTFASSNGLGFFSSTLAWFKNGSNQIVAQIANVAGRGELWLKPAAANVLSKIVPTSTSNETFSLPDKAGAGGTFAMVSDIASGAQVVASANLTAQTSTGTTTILTYAVPADGTFMVACYGGLGSAGGFSATAGINYTDPVGPSVTGMAIYIISGAALVGSLTGNIFLRFLPQTIRAKAGTNIVVEMVGNATGIASFYMSASIVKL